MGNNFAGFCLAIIKKEENVIYFGRTHVRSAHCVQIELSSKK